MVRSLLRLDAHPTTFAPCAAAAMQYWRSFLVLGRIETMDNL
jgi:hypothetical protein